MASRAVPRYIEELLDPYSALLEASFALNLNSYFYRGIDVSRRRSYCFLLSTNPLRRYARRKAATPTRAQVAICSAPICRVWPFAVDCGVGTTTRGGG